MDSKHMKRYLLLLHQADRSFQAAHIFFFYLPVCTRRCVYDYVGSYDPYGFRFIYIIRSISAP